MTVQSVLQPLIFASNKQLYILLPKVHLKNKKKHLNINTNT